MVRILLNGFSLGDITSLSERGSEFVLFICVREGM